MEDIWEMFQSIVAAAVCWKYGVPTDFVAAAKSCRVSSVGSAVKHSNWLLVSRKKSPYIEVWRGARVFGSSKGF